MKKLAVLSSLIAGWVSSFLLEGGFLQPSQFKTLMVILTVSLIASFVFWGLSVKK